MKPKHFDIDLGYDHYLQFTSWHPDRELNPQYKDIPDVEHIGAIIYHGDCSSSIMFDCEASRKIFNERSIWKVEKEEPLTLSPSILCTACRDHGYIREGKWVKG